MGLDVPHPFAKEVKKKRPRGRPAKQGPPPPPKKVVKPPRRIVLPTGRDMDDAIIKIQKQFLLDKNKFKKKMNMGGVMRGRGGTFKGVY